MSLLKTAVPSTTWHPRRQHQCTHWRGEQPLGVLNMQLFPRQKHPRLQKMDEPTEKSSYCPKCHRSQLKTDPPPSCESPVGSSRRSSRSPCPVSCSSQEMLLTQRAARPGRLDQPRHPTGPCGFAPLGGLCCSLGHTEGLQQSPGESPQFVRAESSVMSVSLFPLAGAAGEPGFPGPKGKSCCSELISEPVWFTSHPVLFWNNTPARSYPRETEVSHQALGGAVG